MGSNGSYRAVGVCADTMDPGFWLVLALRRKTLAKEDVRPDDHANPLAPGDNYVTKHPPITTSHHLPTGRAMHIRSD